MIILSALLMIPATLGAQPTAASQVKSGQPIDYFLCEGTHTFDSSVPTPFDVLGFNIGERFVEWGDVVYYMEKLAEASDKVSIEKYGRTYQDRRFIQACITSAANQDNLEQIRREHLQLTDPSASGKLDTDRMPVVVDLMASIHGNEPSGANAAVLLAYYFAATTDEGIDEMLDNTVIIINPGQNPDGINRFATWVNSTTSFHHSCDDYSREGNDPWPSCRTNTYFADCNRDWLSVQHPEGRNNVRMYLDWMPDVVLDMHEQGSGKSGFYFSPGDANRTHKLIPDKNQMLTQEIADDTALALDEKGIVYFSREGYDDFFLGKGAAYGDVQGSVCILHEQCGTYAYVRPTYWGAITFANTVRTQAVAGASVAKSAYKMRKELLDYMRKFYVDQAKTAANDPVKAVRFRIKNDKGREFHLIDNLLFHEIEVYRDAKDEGWYVVPMEQKKYSVFKAMWDKITEFDDSVFYDVSTWSFPYAYNVEFTELTSPIRLGEKVEKAVFPVGSVEGGMSTVGYAFENSEFYAPYMVDELLKEQVIVRVAKKSFTYEHDGMSRTFPAGTMVVPVINQPCDAEALYGKVSKLAAASGVDVLSLKTGRMKDHDLGSSMFNHVRQPHVAIISGRGMGVSETGEAWLAIDRRFDIDHVMMDWSMITKADLGKFNVMVIANGTPTGQVAPNFYEKLEKWVADGGLLIISRGSRAIANKAKVSEIEWTEGRGLSGVILRTDIKKTNPLFWGFQENTLPVYKMSAGTYASARSTSPMKYSKDLYISGYMSDANKEKIAGTSAMLVNDYGRGRVIFFVDDMNFRSYWYGTQKVFVNAIMYGNN